MFGKDALLLTGFGRSFVKQHDASQLTVEQWGSSNVTPCTNSLKLRLPGQTAGKEKSDVDTK